MSKQIKTPPVEVAPVMQGARLPGEERRREILRTAVQLFSKRGFRGTTTKEIAQAAGVSEAIIFRHFANKEELYAAILDHKACESGPLDPRALSQDAVRRQDDRAVFQNLALAALEHHERDPEFLGLLLHSALEGHELAQMFFENTVRPLYEFLTGYIRERQADGALREFDPAVAVRAFLGMIVHHSLNNTLWDQKQTLLNISNEDAAREFTEILLRGISADAGPARAAHGARKRKATVQNARLLKTKRDAK